MVGLGAAGAAGAIGRAARTVAAIRSPVALTVTVLTPTTRSTARWTAAWTTSASAWWWRVTASSALVQA
ncbi:hypothetical protein [Cryptosporangium sp. NPDC051539]|uniref:hypothetical protein n=1 Tax=Cryptosporangium sp. NPDC051539 TaxID=3363962 RepID=UPI00378A4CA4